VHEPEKLAELVPENPQTAPEWWLNGEYALSIENDAQKAEEYFSQAISLAPNRGDYYASRARAMIELNLEQAAHDLDIARFLGTQYEYPNAIAVALSSDAEEIMKLRIKALPPLIQSQNFEGVLFAGRLGNFMPLPPVRFPGPGADAMQPWYDLAANYKANSDIANAIRVYRAILAYAPDESRAEAALEAMQ
jgi:tetratricopeptide (TPR) repeat protein